jgi:hypothetical protein
MRQATHVSGMRRARYLGLPKTQLEHNIAAAINMTRMDAYWPGDPPRPHTIKPPYPTRLHPHRLTCIGRGIPLKVWRHRFWLMTAGDGLTLPAADPLHRQQQRAQRRQPPRRGPAG